MSQSSKAIPRDIDDFPIGRREAWESIVKAMMNAKESRGSVILLEGEAGIGKTHLIDKISKEASSIGMTILRGSCLDYRRAPYLPFKHMLMDHFGITSLGSYEENKTKVLDNLNIPSISDPDFREEFTDLFIPRDEPVGGFRIKVDRRDDLINYLKDSGYRTILLTDREGDEKYRSLHSLDVVRIASEGEGSIPPTRLERIASLLKGSFSRYRHCAVVNDSMDSLVESNPSAKLLSFIKILNGMATENDSIAVNIAREGTEELLSDLREMKYLMRGKERDQDEQARTRRSMSRNEIFSRFVTESATRSPVLIVVEDLQWGDKSSMNLLQYLGRDIHSRRVLIIGSYRPEETSIEDENTDNTSLRAALQRISREKLFSTIMLDRLDPSEQRRLAEEIIGSSMDEKTNAEMVEKTKGNPLFVVQFIEGLKKKKKTMDVPGEVSDPSGNKVISTRISNLDELSRRMLEFASILGDRSRMDMLVNGLELDEEEALDILDRLIDMKFLKESGDVLEFQHPRWKDLIYSDIPQERKREFHLKAAKQIDANPHFKGGERMACLADHYFRAGDLEKSRKAYFKVAEIELERMNEKDAEKALEKALESLSGLASTKENMTHRVKALQLIGDINQGRGDLKEALRSFKKAVDIAEKADIPYGLSSSYRRIGDILLKLFEWGQTVDYYLRSLHLSKKEDDQEEISKAFRGLGTIYYLKGDYTRSMDCYLKYMEFPRTDRRSQNVVALIEMGDIYYEMGDFNQALTYFKLAIKNGEEKDLKLESAHAYARMANILMKLGEVDDAIRFGTWGYNMVKGHLSNEVSEKVILYFIELMIEASDMEKAEEAHDTLIKGPRRELGDQLLIGQRFRTMGLLAAKKRRFDTARENMNKAMEIHRRLEVPFQLGMTYFQFGLINFQEMKVKEAMEMLTEASKIFKSINAIYFLNRTSSKIRELTFINEGFGN